MRRAFNSESHSVNLACTTFLLLILLCSCSLHPGFLLPIVRDDTLETFLAEEAATILRVSENAHRAALYSFYLADFPRRDILGLSLGGRRIFISYELSRRAYEQPSYRWLLRHTLAHEIAHDVLAHAGANQEPALIPGSAGRIRARDLGMPGIVSFRNYPRALELAADEKAVEYWRRIGWDCRIWNAIFAAFLDHGYDGDADHPVDERLAQAIKLCDSAT